MVWTVALVAHKRQMVVLVLVANKAIWDIRNVVFFLFLLLRWNIGIVYILCLYSIFYGIRRYDRAWNLSVLGQLDTTDVAKEIEQIRNSPFHDRVRSTVLN